MTTTRLALEGIPETMLWTLHNRAGEARKPNGYLKDPDCLRIYDAIDYDYTRNFGSQDGSHPMRSRLFDAIRWFTGPTRSGYARRDLLPLER